MRVIATSGHVDHGKSTLVRALTGVDPDRLAEEKRRGLTIELGFAGMTLPSGERLSFVDVPGHRRFIGNMLAGLGPAPAVLFVVAADQGWQAQSTEHLEAVDALGLRHGLLVLTRCGLADAERIAAVRQDALARIAQSSLREVAAVATDAVEGAGLVDLRAALDTLIARMPPIDPTGPVRLWVDRSFSKHGTGTVVTGTLGSGTLRVDDQLVSGGHVMSVRALEVLGAKQDSVGPVSRVAIALRSVAAADVPRGASLSTPHSYVESRVVDVRRETGLGWSQASPRLAVHLGTAAVVARVRAFDDLSARLTLERPLPIRLGDRLILRDDSADRIHCGATVLDLDPAPLRRRGAAADRAQRLQHRLAGQAAPLVADRGCVETEWLDAAGARDWRSWLATSDGDCLLIGEWAVSQVQLKRWADALAALVDGDAADELSAGVALTAAAGTLGAPDSVVEFIARERGMRLEHGRITGAQHKDSLGSAQAAVDELRTRLAVEPFDAPEAKQLDELGLGARQLAAAAQRGLLLRLPGDVILLPDAPARAMRVLAALDQPFTTSDARQALGTTRRVVIPLLEHLDARGWTRREDTTHRSVVRSRGAG